MRTASLPQLGSKTEPSSTGWSMYLCVLWKTRRNRWAANFPIDWWPGFRWQLVIWCKYYSWRRAVSVERTGWNRAELVSSHTQVLLCYLSIQCPSLQTITVRHHTMQALQNFIISECNHPGWKGQFVLSHQTLCDIRRICWKGDIWRWNQVHCWKT